VKKYLLFTAGFVSLMAAPAFAQQPEIDCAKAEAQMEMNYCADLDYAEADKALNAQWALTKKAAALSDSYREKAERAGEKTLLKSQRSWIEYRDATCEVAGYPMRGGTGEPYLVLVCLKKVTDTRTKELKDLADALRLR
jgi:uncharacterized protein YecT (DUF1311 family)